MVNDDMTMQGSLGWQSGLNQYQSNQFSTTMEQEIVRQQHEAYVRQLQMQSANMQAYHALQSQNAFQPAKTKDDPLLVLLTEE